jgi:hypothetical protein
MKARSEEKRGEEKRDEDRGRYGAAIRVAGHEHRWKAGEAMVFDDSFVHEAWYEHVSSAHVSSADNYQVMGTEGRLVLIVDFWHPQLRPAQRELLQKSPFRPWTHLKVCVGA